MGCEHCHSFSPQLLLMCLHYYRNFKRPTTTRIWMPAGRVQTHWRSPYTVSVAVSSSDLAVQRRNSCTSTQQLSACRTCVRLQLTWNVPLKNLWTSANNFDMFCAYILRRAIDQWARQSSFHENLSVASSGGKTICAMPVSKSYERRWIRLRFLIFRTLYSRFALKCFGLYFLSFKM